MKQFFNDNGSLIKNQPTASKVNLTYDPEKNTHTLTLTAVLEGMGTEDKGSPLLYNTIYISEDKAGDNLSLSAPEIHFSAVDEAVVYLNLKVRIDADKKNHASFISEIHEKILLQIKDR